MTTPYEVAKQLVGQQEGYKNDLLNRFLNGDTRGMTSAQFAWCSRFVKQAAVEAGVPPETLKGATDMARSWMNVGKPVDQPQQGDVVVFSRGAPGSGQGHVGFYEGPGSTPGTLKVLGGNQGDRVAVSDYPASRVLGYRRLEDPGRVNVANNGSISGGQSPERGKEMLPQLLAALGGPTAAAAETASAGGMAGGIDAFVQSLFGKSGASDAAGQAGGGLPFGMKLSAPDQMAQPPQMDMGTAADQMTQMQAPLDRNRLREVIARRPSLGIGRGIA